MHNRLAILLLILLCGLVIVSADDLPILDINDVLGENFQIVSQSPTVFWDDDLRIVTYISYETDQRIDIPYPNEVNIFKELSDYGTYSFLLKSWDSTTWLFEPLTQTIKPAPTQCDLTQSPLGKGYWIQIVNEVGDIAFCNTETGQLTNKIPQLTVQNLECYYEGVQNPVIEIVEENQLLGITCDTVQAYVYSIDSDQFSILGKMEEYFNGYLPNSEQPYRGFNYKYLGNSNILIELPRWEQYFNSPFDSQLYFANLKNEASVEFIGFDTEYSLLTNQYYWSEVDKDKSQVIVHSFDVDTLEQSIWKTFDCIPMKTCINGQIFLSPNLKHMALTNMATWIDPYPELGMIVLDTQSGELIGEDESFVSHLIWIDDSQFIAVNELSFRSLVYHKDISETDISTLQTESFNLRLNPSEDRRYFIFYVGDSYDLFDVIDWKRYSLVSQTSMLIEMGDKSYTVNIAPRWIDGKQIEITVYAQSTKMILDVGK